MLFSSVVPNSKDADFYSLQYMHLGNCKTERPETLMENN